MSSKNTVKFSKLGFDNPKYLKLQKEAIQERIKRFSTGRLYLEMGGKFPNDSHASRVLPGYSIDNKLQVILSLGKIDLVICLNSQDIENNRAFDNSGTSYEDYVLKLLTFYQDLNLPKPKISLNMYIKNVTTDEFVAKLESKGFQIYKRFPIAGYPDDTALITSEEGYGKDEYIEVKNSIVLVTSPGSNSGKMSTCLGQIYHESKLGQDSGYAKYETFPIWNLPLEHPVNLAYESATIDIGDYNEEDPFYKEAYDKTAINYNRDIAAFPIIQSISKGIVSENNYMNTYKSPTDMGVNMTGFCITDDEIVRKASSEEIIRRYYWTREAIGENRVSQEVNEDLKQILRRAKLKPGNMDIVAESIRSGKIAYKSSDNEIELYDNIQSFLSKKNKQDTNGSRLHSVESLSDKYEEILDKMGVVYTTGK